MKTSQDTPITIEASTYPVRARVEAIFSVAALGGVAVAVIAALWPVEEKPRASVPVAAPAPIAAMAEPVANPAPAPAPPTVVQVPETVIEAPRPELAIAHEDLETDFEAIAMSAVGEGELERALEALRKHVHFHDPTAANLLEIARLSRELNKLALAEEALRQAGALEPSNAEVEIELGRVLLAADDHSGAAAAAARAVKLDKENASAWNLTGRVAMKKSEWERAEIAFRRAVGLEPTDGLLHNNLGLLYVYMRRGEQAVESMETSAELFGEDGPDFVYNNLGLAYELNGQLGEARDSFIQALEVNPSYGRAQANLRRVEERIAKLEEEGRPVETAKVVEKPKAAPEAPAPEVPEAEDDGEQPAETFNQL